MNTYTVFIACDRWHDRGQQCIQLHYQRLRAHFRICSSVDKPPISCTYLELSWWSQPPCWLPATLCRTLTPPRPPTLLFQVIQPNGYFELTLLTTRPRNSWKRTTLRWTKYTRRTGRKTPRWSLRIASKMSTARIYQISSPEQATCSFV